MMKTASATLIAGLALASIAMPQGRPTDWPSFGGDARRTGWERSDIRITKDNVKDFKLVLKRKLEGAGADATPPVVIGLLISYKGFKELGFVQGAGGSMWSLDVDLNKPFWHRKLQAGSCGMPVPALTPPAVFGGRRPGAPAPGSASPGLPPTTAGRSTEMPARLGGGGFGGPRPIYAVSGDGMLRMLNTADGSDQFPALPFLPANSKASVLTMNDYVMYTTTSAGCGQSGNALWAIDLRETDPKPVSYKLDGVPGGLAGYAVGNDGSVYVQTSDLLMSFSGRSLQPTSKMRFGPGTSKASATPVVFDYKGRDVVVSAGRDGRLYVSEGKHVGGADGRSPLSQTVPLTSGGGVWGGLASWEDADGTRWVAAPVWGALNSELKLSGSAPNGSVVAFKVDDQNGAPVLVPAWVSRDLRSPVPPVVTAGVVFALSTAGKATLYALDGATGKEMWSSGAQVPTAASLTGLSIANGRIYFTTTDGTLYAFGVFLEI